MQMNNKEAISTQSTNEYDERFESFVNTVTRAYKTLQRIKNQATESMGLRGNHVMCMHYLGINPEGLTATELCKLCNEDKAAVSRTVMDLTQKGLVISTDLESKRKYRAVIKLSPIGEEYNNRIGSIIVDSVKKTSVDFTDEERKCFYKVFESIIASLEELIKEE